MIQNKRPIEKTEASMDVELLYSREESEIKRPVSHNHDNVNKDAVCRPLPHGNIAQIEHTNHINVHNKSIKPNLVSLSVYRYLCENIVGSKETVQTKRLFITIKDKLHYDDNLANLTSGSFGEGLELRGSDRDIVVVYKHMHVYDNPGSVPLPFTSGSFYIDVNETQPGYARLRLIVSIDEETRKKCIKEGSKWYLSNESFKSLINFACSVKDVSTPHGPSLSDKQGEYDFVLSLHCPDWISQCKKWITRSKTTWPDPELKTRISNHGVLFVPVGSKRSAHTKLEWRISFSVCEKLLVCSFNHTQLLAYTLMKILLKDVIKRTAGCEKFLSSYYVKNIVFWLCEEVNKQVWEPDNLIPCFLSILNRCIYCVKYLVCPHYFIPDNNMFEETFDTHERQILLETLIFLNGKGWRCLLLSKQFNNFDISVRDISFQYDASFNLIKHLLCSTVLNDDGVEFSASTSKQLYKRAISLAVSHASTKIKSICTFFLSRFASNIGQRLPEPGVNQNKEAYNIYRLRISYLLQTNYLDAVSGWLMVATFFHHYKHFKNAVEVLKYALENCTPEKVYFQCNLTKTQLEIAKLTSLVKPTIASMIKLHVLTTIDFLHESLLIPTELGQDIKYAKCCLPPLAYAQFLSILCYSELRDEQSCGKLLKDIIETIRYDKFIGTPDKAIALNCLKILVAGSSKREQRMILAAAVFKDEEKLILHKELETVHNLNTRTDGTIGKFSIFRLSFRNIPIINNELADEILTVCKNGFPSLSVKHNTILNIFLST